MYIRVSEPVENITIACEVCIDNIVFQGHMTGKYHTVSVLHAQRKFICIHLKEALKTY